MSKTFEIAIWRRCANWSIARLLRLGVPIGNNYLLTVPGRKSGKLRTTPVTLLDRGGERYLVAPYGEVDWVWNARAAGRVTLSRGRVQEHTDIEELAPEDAAPVLKQYVHEVPIVRPYFDADKDSDLKLFEADARRKAVFRLVP
jgi:deazaflavin-dependent oxidoreductase (nitroreductase family)